MCFQCKSNTTHNKISNILQVPNFLIVIINRFVITRNGYMKNRNAIEIDYDLQLNDVNYHLLAVIDHHGFSINNGHYTTNIICGNNVYYCNDKKVMESKMNPSIHSSDAYIVLYKKHLI